MAALLIAVSHAAGAPSAAADEVAWSAERPLVWTDFAGGVARGTASENVAATVASLDWTYGYEYERSRERCRYRITEIRAFATFHPDQSWVRPEHTTAEVLAHEQGHFDITQIHKLLFETATQHLVGAGGLCEGRSDNRISRFIENAVGRRIGRIYEEIWGSHMRAQARYDRETGHGTRAVAQRAWLERIAAALDGHAWAEAEFEAAAR